jgi:hypothetical protein
MKRLACFGLAALVAVCFGVAPTAAQDEKKPNKKPPAGKPEKGDKKKGDAKDEEMKEKGEAKSEGEKGKDKDSDKAPEPTDEKQKKQFDKIRLGIEKKFRKSTKETVYVYTTTEKVAEKIESTSEPTPGVEPGKGGRDKGRGTQKAGGGVEDWEIVVKNNAYMTKDRDEAVEKVYKFIVEYPPPLPGARKKKGEADDGPPPPQRDWAFIKAFPATKEGEKQAEAEHERLDRAFQKQAQQAAWKKQQRKKGA